MAAESVWSEEEGLDTTEEAAAIAEGGEEATRPIRLAVVGIPNVVRPGLLWDRGKERF